MLLGLTSVANVFLYLFMTVTARNLPPATYSLFASSFGFVVLLGMAYTAVQTSVAAHLAGMAASRRTGYLQRLARRIGVQTLCLLAGSLAAAPLVSSFTHSPGTGPAISLAFVVAAQLPWSAYLGFLQGSGRITALGTMTAVQAACRLATVAVLLFSSDVTLLISAVGVSIVLALLVGLAYSRIVGHPERRFACEQVPSGSGPLPFRFSLLTAVTLGFPTVGDVILVRHTYDPHSAGLYAGVALIGRTILFPALAIGTAMFPRFVGQRPSRRLLAESALAAGLVAGVPCLVVAAEPAWALQLLVGPGYQRAAGLLTWYVLGCLAYGVAALFAYYLLARGRRVAVTCGMGSNLAGQLALPFVVGHDAVALVAVGSLLAAAFLASMAVMAWRDGEILQPDPASLA